MPGIIVIIWFSAKFKVSFCKILIWLIVKSTTSLRYSLISVATWSFLDLPVCSFFPAAPTIFVNLFSIFIWTSSKSTDHLNFWVIISFFICFSPFVIPLKSATEIIFCFLSISACAREPSISNIANLWSKLTDAVNLLTISLVGSENLSDHFFVIFFMSAYFYSLIQWIIY